MVNAQDSSSATVDYSFYICPFHNLMFLSLLIRYHGLLCEDCFCDLGFPKLIELIFKSTQPSSEEPLLKTFSAVVGQCTVSVSKCTIIYCLPSVVNEIPSIFRRTPSTPRTTRFCCADFRHKYMHGPLTSTIISLGLIYFLSAVILSGKVRRKHTVPNQTHWGLVCVLCVLRLRLVEKLVLFTVQTGHEKEGFNTAWAEGMRTLFKSAVYTPP